MVELNVIRERIHRDVVLFFKNTQQPSRAHILAGKYNKLLKPHGVVITDLLLSDERLICKQNVKTQGWYIVPYAELCEFFKDTPDEVIPDDKMGEYQATYWRGYLGRGY